MANVVDNLVECAAAHVVESKVHPAAICKRENLLRRLGMTAIIDRLVCTERASPLELGVVARSDDHASTGELGKLETENRNATRAKDQHRFPRLERVGLE